MNIRKTFSRLFGRPVEVRSSVWDAAGCGNRLANWTAPSTNFVA
jgi:hypothetical protein